MFIVILASPDRAETVRWYCDNLSLNQGDTYTLEYSMINDAFDKPAGTVSDLTMVQNNRLPLLEVEDYPEEAEPRSRHAGLLPPGYALVTLAIESFDKISVDWITPPTAREGALYQGRRAGTISGPAGELLELVEIG
jgi:hypothetical protein